MRKYEELPTIGAFLLEESYVLDIDARPGAMSMEVDLVLTPEHPDYEEPRADEQFCYRRGRISFSDVKALSWGGQGMPPAVDATGERDYGNIDRFEWARGRYLLEGSFGLLEVDASGVEVILR